MSQTRIWDFGAPRKSQYLNDHFVGIVPTKSVYSGYSVRATSPASLNLDIKLDGATASILMTEEGIKVTETADLLNAVTIVPDPAQDRIDYVVAAHQYTNANNPQTYEVIQGTAGSPPIPPASVPQYKVLLATVYVPAAAAAITDDLINQSEYINIGNDFGRDGFLELRPDPQTPPTNTVFVNGGTYVDSLGSSAVTVADDIAAAVTFPTVTAPGQERIDLIGLNDAGAAVRIAGVEAAAGLAAPPAYPNNIQVVGEITIDEPTAVLIRPGDIRDVRFIFNLGSLGGVAGEFVAARATDTTPSYLFNKLSAGTNITFNVLNPGANEQIQVNASVPAAGEANTSSNAGGTAGLALPKAGVDLPFKGITPGGNISFTVNANDVVISGRPEQLDLMCRGIVIAPDLDFWKTTNGGTTYLFMLPNSLLKYVHFSQGVVDSGAAQPTVMLTVNGAPALTANVVLSAAPDTPVVGTVIGGGFPVANTDSIEVQIVAPGTNGDAANVHATLLFNTV